MELHQQVVLRRSAINAQLTQRVLGILLHRQEQLGALECNRLECGTSNMSFGGRGGNQYDEMAQMASMNMMMGIMKSCFNDCVADFRSSDLSGNEKTCI